MVLNIFCAIYINFLDTWELLNTHKIDQKFSYFRISDKNVLSLTENVKIFVFFSKKFFQDFSKNVNFFSNISIFSKNVNFFQIFRFFSKLWFFLKILIFFKYFDFSRNYDFFQKYRLLTKNFKTFFFVVKYLNK